MGIIIIADRSIIGQTDAVRGEWPCDLALEAGASLEVCLVVDSLLVQLNDLVVGLRAV